MIPRHNLMAWSFVLFFCAALLTLGGCASVESVWYGCTSDGAWRGFSYVQECQRIFKAARA